MDEHRDELGPAALETAADTEDFGVAPAVAAAYRLYLRDLPQLLEERPEWWVAYSSTQRLGFSRTKTDLYQKCLAQGLGPDEFLVRWIGPELEIELT